MGREVPHPTRSSSEAPPMSMKAGSHQSLLRWINSLMTRDQMRLNTVHPSFLRKNSAASAVKATPSSAIITA